jgi:hypothetical protein
MEQFYKGHRIEVSVWRDGDGWCAKAEKTWRFWGGFHRPDNRLSRSG